MATPLRCFQYIIVLVAGVLPAVCRAVATATPPGAAKVIPVFPHLNVPKSQQTVANYAWPTLQYFPAPAAKANGAAVVICPGGGYVEEVMQWEGYGPAAWMNKLGVTAFVLKYRLPKGKLPPGGVPWPLQDVRRAVQIIRAHAKQWHIDPHRIGVMGFSAGGHLASMAGTHWVPANPNAADPLNRFSTRPDFLVLGYPVISMKRSITHPGSRQNLLGNHPPRSEVLYFSSELQVNATTPPTFITCARDDNIVPIQNSIRFAAAMHKVGVPCDFKLFNVGGHGFGLGRPGQDSDAWTGDCARWLRRMGFLSKSR